MNLIIDIGNSRVKAALFDNDVIIAHYVFLQAELITKLDNICMKYCVSNSIISSVTAFSEIELRKIDQLLRPLFLSTKTKLPFVNLYRTPKTLGLDRLALVAAAVKKYPKKNCLIIDVGTCITYDFVNEKTSYLGGAISPGVQMRYKALNMYTSKLPLLKPNILSDFIGTDTQNSIHSGIVNGVCSEIKGFISQYNTHFKDLTVVLTGGDTKFLEEQLKSIIFVEPNFVLEGLQTILIYNVAND
ncbi:MAG: type III pantothenate kinase [Tenacibaculum sp.]